MDALLDAVGDLTSAALNSAANLADSATDAAAGATSAALGSASQIYNYYRSAGMSPEDAADATERTLREMTGRVII